jgi:hypothetical protein
VGEKGNEMATEIASINREFTGHSFRENVKTLIEKRFVILWKHDWPLDEVLLMI